MCPTFFMPPATNRSTARHSAPSSFSFERNQSGAFTHQGANRVQPNRSNVRSFLIIAILRPLTDEEELALIPPESNRRKVAVTAEAPEEIPVEIPTEEVLETTVDSSAEDEDIYETLRKKPRRQMTLLDAAYRVLTEYGGALTTGEIVDAALRKGYWQTEGKTPANTLNAAIAREIKLNGETSRFQKGERGHFLARETE